MTGKADSGEDHDGVVATENCVSKNSTGISLSLVNAIQE